MHVLDTPPDDWDARIASPFLSCGFALASGQRTLYIDGGTARALVLLSARLVPVGRSWGTRATVYVSGGDAAFLRALLREVAELGIGRARVGDANVGLPRLTLQQAGITPVTSHRLAHTTSGDDHALLARWSPRRLTALKYAEREGVVVSEIRGEAELEHYCALPAYAGLGGVGMPPMAFFAILRAMVPKGQAVFFLARHDGRPIAGALYLVSRHRMSCFHEVSTRAPELTHLQGPTAIIWHAMRVARDRAVPCFDLGTVTPTRTPSDPEFGSDHFKREFGGVLEDVHHGEVRFSHGTRALQELLLPAWKRIAAFGARPRREVGAA